jgi:hypothetical protein
MATPLPVIVKKATSRDTSMMAHLCVLGQGIFYSNF